MSSCASLHPGLTPFSQNSHLVSPTSSGPHSTATRHHNGRPLLQPGFLTGLIALIGLQRDKWFMWQFEPVWLLKWCYYRPSQSPSTQHFQPVSLLWGLVMPSLLEWLGFQCDQQNKNLKWDFEKGNHIYISFTVKVNSFPEVSLNIL